MIQFQKIFKISLYYIFIICIKQYKTDISMILDMFIMQTCMCNQTPQSPLLYSKTWVYRGIYDKMSKTCLKYQTYYNNMHKTIHNVSMILDIIIMQACLKYQTYNNNMHKTIHNVSMILDIIIMQACMYDQNPQNPLLYSKSNRKAI